MEEWVLIYQPEMSSVFRVKVVNGSPMARESLFPGLGITSDKYSCQSQRKLEFAEVVAVTLAEKYSSLSMASSTWLAKHLFAAAGTLLMPVRDKAADQKK